MIFIFVLVALFLGGAGYVFSSGRRVQRLTRNGWESALGRVHLVNLAQLRELMHHLERSQADSGVTIDEMWKMVGGLKGVGRLKANATAMLDLALLAERSDVFVEQWNREERQSVSELIRAEALSLNKTVRRIQIAHFVGLSFLHLPKYLQATLQSYDSIRSHLLGLYEKSHGSLFPQLEAVLQAHY